MFYRITRWIVLLLVMASLCFAVGIAAAWIDIKQVILVLQLFLITVGAYVFYVTRPSSTKSKALKIPLLIIHISAVPVAVLLAYALRHEAFAAGNWFMLNLVMLFIVGGAWLNILAGIPAPGADRMLLSLYSIVFVCVLALHMCGKISNGKIVFFMGIMLIVAALCMVLLRVRKPQVAAEGPQEVAPSNESIS